VGGRVTSRSERVALIDRRDDQPRDATRGGVNFAALPRNPPKGGHRESPLWIDAGTLDVRAMRQRQPWAAV